MRATVSVVMTVFNNAPFLRQSVESVLSQTAENFEFILVDDGSTDGSTEICEELARADRRIRLLQKANTGSGGVPALNIGIEKARGELIARCDADDLWLPDKLRLHLAAMDDEPKGVATFTNARCIDETGAPCQAPFAGCFSGESRGEALAHRLMQGNILCHSTAIFHRQQVRDLGGFRSKHFRSTDHDMWLRLAAVGDLALFPEILTLYRIHRHNVSFREPKDSMADASRVLLENICQIQKRWPMPGPVLSASLRVMAFAAWHGEDWSLARRLFEAIGRLRPLDSEERAALADCARYRRSPLKTSG